MAREFRGSHHRHLLWWLVVSTLLLLLIPLEYAHGAEGINKQLPFYGTLNDSEGEALTGTYDMLFTIYDAPTGGSALWTGTYTSANGNAVSVEDGEFSVMLGSGTGNILTLDFNDDTYYLGVTIGTDPEMTPRERLGAAGYAFNADMLDGLHASDFLQSNAPISLNQNTTTSLLTLTQSGAGDFMSFFDASEDNLFRVDGVGRVYASSFESLVDEVNTFAGALDVVSADNSSFGGSIVVAYDSGLMLGGGDGVMLWQDLSAPTDLMLTPVGESIGGDVRIVSPSALAIHANMDAGDTGSEYPSLIFNTNGLAQLINLSGEGGDDARLELSFTNGTEVTDGGLVVSDGGVSVTGGGITSEFDVEITDLSSTFRASSLAGSAFELESDVNGNIVLGPPVVSDERFKQNIQTIDNALQMVLDLRGVRYEWKDAERFGSQTEVGFIAQEVQEVIPEVVRDNGEYLSLNTKNIVAVVVEAIKELYERVENYFARTERLEREVDALRREIEVLKGNESEETEPVTTVPPDESSESTQEPAPEESVVTEPIEESIPEEEVAVPDVPPSELPLEV